MKYEMKVIIYDPKTPDGMNSDMLMDMIAEFYYDSKQYGNGHSLLIKTTDRKFRMDYDLRYDDTFDKNNKIEYLTKWVTNYWSGNDDAYAVREIKIRKM